MSSAQILVEAVELLLTGYIVKVVVKLGQIPPRGSLVSRVSMPTTFMIYVSAVARRGPVKGQRTGKKRSRVFFDLMGDNFFSELE